MSYETVLEQVKAAPEECLDEISVLIDDLVERYKRKNENADGFIFDSLVHHTERADHADEYIRTLRDNDRF